MLMLFIHVLFFLLSAAVAVFFAVLAFKHKWYSVVVFDVAVAFTDLVFMIITIIEYFTN